MSYKHGLTFDMKSKVKHQFESPLCKLKLLIVTVHTMVVRRSVLILGHDESQPVEDIIKRDV